MWWTQEFNFNLIRAFIFQDHELAYVGEGEEGKGKVEREKREEGREGVKERMYVKASLFLRDKSRS